MAKPNLRRLKVFQAQIGFYDTVVAAPNRAAALRAWGTHQNLFASGQAHETEDSQPVQAALAHPEVPLKRAVGSGDPFGLTANLPKVPDSPKRSRPAKAKPKAGPTPKPSADRSALDRAERALRKLDDDRKTEEADFKRRQEKLDMERDAAQAAYVRARAGAKTTVIEAKEAYRNAGGEDLT